MIEIGRKVTKVYRENKIEMSEEEFIDNIK